MDYLQYYQNQIELLSEIETLGGESLDNLDNLLIILSARKEYKNNSDANITKLYSNLARNFDKIQRILTSENSLYQRIEKELTDFNG